MWHRYYIHIFEQKLHECGYTGSLPYWEWGLDAYNPHASPIFDGSDTSLGSDGAFIAGPPMVLNIPGNVNPIVLAKGTGGGCVTTGPFKDMTVHLGPITQADPTADNPRCLKRDLNADAGKRFASFRNTTDLIINSPNIEVFRTTMEGDPRYIPDSLGVHGGGHFMISGDPGSDAFISSGDPAFYLHHGEIDRVYWIWQMLDFQNRQVCVPCYPWLDMRVLELTGNRAFLAPPSCLILFLPPTRPSRTSLIFRPSPRRSRSRIS